MTHRQTPKEKKGPTKSDLLAGRRATANALVHALIVEGVESREFVPVDVTPEEYAAWVAVETDIARNEATGQRTPATEEAFSVYLRVKKRLDAAERGGVPAVPVPPAVTQPPPIQMSRDEIFAHAVRRARDLGIPHVLLLAQEPRRRSPEATARKRAREKVIVELRDRGATQGDIGAVFGGRTQPSVSVIEQSGRKRRLADIAEQAALHDGSKTPNRRRKNG